MSRFRTDPLSVKKMPATFRKRVVKQQRAVEDKTPGARRTQEIPTLPRR